MFANPEKNVEQFGIEPGMSIADLGSGVGFYSIALAKAAGPSGRVYAVDIQKDLLSKLQNDAAKMGVHNIKLIWGDLDLPNSSTLSENSVDRVVLANIIFQITEKDILINEAYRILKPGGQLLFVDWRDSYGGLGPKHDDIIKEDVAKALLESNNFSLVRDIQTGDHHYGFIARK